MAVCPNCGRQTLRTIDWACQWCGYPLISRAYKKIDKTFKELQEERKLAQRSPEPEDELEPEYEAPPEPAPEPEPPPKYVFRHRTTEPPPQPSPRPAPQPEYRQPPQPAPPPRSEPAPEIAPRQAPPQAALPRYEPPPQPVQQVAPPPPPKYEPPPPPETAPAPSVMITPPPLVQAPPLAQAPPQVPPPVPRPEVRVEPVPATVVTADSIQEGVEITADQLDALFRTDKSAVHSKLSGKTIIIRGIVEKVFIREHLEIRYIMVTGSSKKLTWSIRCQFNKEDSQKAARLNEGQEVRLRAKYDSYSKNIIFKDCVLF